MVASDSLEEGIALQATKKDTRARFFIESTLSSFFGSGSSQYLGESPHSGLIALCVLATTANQGGIGRPFGTL